MVVEESTSCIYSGTVPKYNYKKKSASTVQSFCEKIASRLKLSSASHHLVLLKRDIYHCSFKVDGTTDINNALIPAVAMVFSIDATTAINIF